MVTRVPLTGTADDEKVEFLRRSLRDGEQLLWAGQAPQGWRLTLPDMFLIPFSLIWGGFAIFWEYGVLNMPGPVDLFFALWGLPFVILGLYLIVGRFWVDALRRKNSLYAVTDRRILIQSGILAPQLQSLDARTLSNVQLTEYGDGRGTIMFGNANTLFMPTIRVSWPGADRGAPPYFDTIENARGVYEIILRIQEAKR
jgi:hypothetical protein